MNWYQYAISQIDREIERISSILDRQSLPTVDRLFWEGRRRELRAARWLVRRLAAPIPSEVGEIPAESWEPDEVVAPIAAAVTPPTQAITPLINPGRVLGRNLTPIPLEIDILRLDRQQELLQIIWQQLQRTIRELEGYELSAEQLIAKLPVILTNIWLDSTTEFVGQFYTVTVDRVEYTVLPYLLQDEDFIATEFLAKIPLVYDIFAYLLWQQPIVVDRELYEYGDRIASDRVQQLLDNLAISIGNAVVQPLLNRFNDFEQVKQRFFDPRLISTREITKFRNLLSWHYRRRSYFLHPIEVFESRHTIRVFTDRGIELRSIYAPRRQELANLRGIPLIVSLGLEFRDAIAPLVTAITTFLGRIVVYILTEIIGKGIGLITKGILQGVGNAWQGNR